MALLELNSGIPKPKLTEAAGLLLNYQLEWFDEDADVAFAEKSRRIGLSWAEAAKSAMTACTSREGGGMDVFYMSYNKEMTQTFINDCAYWIKVYGLAADNPVEEVIQDEDKDVLTYVIKCASGFEIRTLPGKATALRSKQGRVVLDEAAFVEDIGGILKAAIALLMWGGCLRVISTHDGVDNPFNEYIKDIRAKKLSYALHSIPLKKAVKQGLVKRIFKMRNKVWSKQAEREWEQDLRSKYGDAAAEELDAIPSNSGGRYLSRALLESVAIPAPVLTFSQKPEWATNTHTLKRTQQTDDWLGENVTPILSGLSAKLPVSYGQDFGRHADLSVIALLQTQSTLQRHTILQLELSCIPHAQQRYIFDWLSKQLKRLECVAIDATGNGEALAEHAADKLGSSDSGGPVHQIKISNAWYNENLPVFKAALEDGEYSIPADNNTIDDLRALQVIDGIPKLPKVTGQTGRHGDAAIAHALAHFASRQDCNHYAWHGLNQNPSVARDPLAKRANRDRRNRHATKHQKGLL